MPISNLPGLIPTSAVDVVGVFTSDFRQVFVNARPIKANIKEPTKIMEHPLEDGATTVDHRIILPIEIELSMILRPSDYRNTYSQIRQIKQDGTLLTIQTRVASYTNQLIEDIPHQEDTEYFDTIILSIILKEVQFVQPQYNILPRDPTNSPTTDRGTQQGSTPAPSQQTTAQIGWNGAGQLFKRGAGIFQ